MNDLKNKVIIVTGGSGLLGNEIVQQLFDYQAIVINLDLTAGPNKAIYKKVDVTSQTEIKNSFQEIFETHKKIDGLVNSAYPRTSNWGIPFEEDKNLESWRVNVDLQLNSYVACCQEVLPFMKMNTTGSIINLSSIYGIVGNDFSLYKDTGINTAAAYSAIKGGLINFSRYLASYVGEYQIRVNCVSPGGIYDNQDKMFVDNYISNVPLKRMAEPEDVAPSVCFLLSDDSKYITGTNLIVDGGYTAI